jgi:hypothetical protein
VLTTALALSTATGMVSASPQPAETTPQAPAQTQCSAPQDIQLTAEETDKVADVAPEQKQSAIEKSKEKLRDVDNADKLDFEHANVMATQAGAQKVWTTIAQERKENSDEDYIFYSVAVDLE